MRLLKATALVALSVVALLAVTATVVLAQDGLPNVDPQPSDITFAFLLTAAGAGIAAGIITALTELVKAVVPPIAEKLTGATMAFIFSLILFVLAGIAVQVESLDEGLVVFLAWLTCATSSVGIYAAVRGGAFTK